MLIYQQVHKYDLDVLGLILEQIEYADSSNIKKLKNNLRKKP